MAQGITVNQNIVPQMYLLNWGQTVWVFDKTTQRSFPTDMSNVAVRRHFYDVAVTLDKNRPERFQTVEKSLSKSLTDSVGIVTAFLIDQVLWTPCITRVRWF